jgi:hypothetical protein
MRFKILVSFEHIYILEPQWLLRPPNKRHILGHIGLIISGSLRPSNGTVNRGSLYLVSMQEEVKDPIQVRNMSSLAWPKSEPLGQ